MNDFHEQWKKEEQAFFEGWDFSYIKDRMIEEQPSWDYVFLAKNLVQQSSSLLDIATGGGEVLSQLAPLPTQTVAIEGFEPNVEVARNNLAQLGVDVSFANETENYPFEDGQFDLVLNRHGGLNLKEIYRVLKPGGKFLTQQVNGDNLEELVSYFGVKPQWPSNILSVVKKKAEDIGFQVIESKEWSGQVMFKDVGAIVYFLKTTPWVVEGFSVDKNIVCLDKLQERLQERGSLQFEIKRFMIMLEK